MIQLTGKVADLLHAFFALIAEHGPQAKVAAQVLVVELDLLLDAVVERQRVKVPLVADVVHARIDQYQIELTRLTCLLHSIALDK